MSEKIPRGSSSGPVYTVEARVAHAFPPKIVCGQMFDNVWRHVNIVKAPVGFGVPSNSLLNPLALHHGYLSYEAAMALAWWFVSSADSLSVETRLVEHQFECSYSYERRAEGAAISMFNKRIEDTAKKQKGEGDESSGI